MAIVRPFCGIRYNPKNAGDLSLLTAPPYDQISKELQKDLHIRHPYNVVRLILGLDYPEDSEINNKYTRAQKTFKEWFLNGILVQDNIPSLYIYEQKFFIDNKSHSRTGIIALVQVEPFEKRIVLPHEKILSKPFEDRKKLLLETEMHFESIFLLYPDKEGYTLNAKQQLMQNKPIMEVTYDNNILHRVWRLTDSLLIEKLIDFWQPLQFFIADGHHRYNTAIECSRYCLATLFCLEDPNLVILPIHRVIRNLEDFDTQLFMNKASRYFEIKDLLSIDELLNAIAIVRQYNRYGYGVVVKGHFCLLVLRDGVDLKLFNSEGVSKLLMQLDVSVLHQILLGEILGIDGKKVKSGDHIEYIRWPEDVLEKIDNGNAQIAFLLNPTRIEDVQKISLADETMPQKSTDFYPKLLSGLVMSYADIF